MYLLFAGEDYYPRGGWYDYKGAFATLGEAKARAANLEVDWWHIVELGTGIVESGPI